MLSNEDEAILSIFSLSVHPFLKSRYFENQQRIFYWQYVACYYWIVSLVCISAQAAQIYTKIHWVFLLGGGAARICMEVYTVVCFHVGQMLFAAIKYLLLKRIRVWGS